MLIVAGAGGRLVKLLMVVVAARCRWLGWGILLYFCRVCVCVFRGLGVMAATEVPTHPSC